MRSLYSRTVRTLGTTKFFAVVMAIFLAESIWVALSAKFPMAFDEGYFHYSIITVYAHHWGPVFFRQPPGPAKYGALVHNTSFLYHYFMSFPYRLVSLWTPSLMAHVITLRLIDVCLFGIGLILFRKLLGKTKASPAIINVSMLFFILMPTIPLLAGQINYDNGFIPLVALSLLLTVNFVEQLRKGRFNITRLIVLYSICLLSCMVKFPFLPILTGITLYLIFEIWVFAKSHKHHFLSKIKKDWHKISIIKRSLLIIFLLFSVLFWLDIYGVNIVKYHNPVAQCGQILGDNRCQAYAPWARNFADAKANTGVDVNPLRFGVSWGEGMFERLFFTINGPGGPASNENHLAPVVSITALVLAIFGILIFVFRYGKSILKNDPVICGVLFICFVYVVSLWGRNYHDFLNLGQIVAINGRYLFPILPPVYLVIAMSYQRMLTNAGYWKLALLALAFVLYIDGGGAIGFVYYSNNAWYWPYDKTAVRINQDAKKIVNPLFMSHRAKRLTL